MSHKFKLKLKRNPSDTGILIIKLLFCLCLQSQNSISSLINCPRSPLTFLLEPKISLVESNKEIKDKNAAFTSNTQLNISKFLAVPVPILYPSESTQIVESKKSIGININGTLTTGASEFSKSVFEPTSAENQSMKFNSSTITFSDAYTGTFTEFASLESKEQTIFQFLQLYEINFTLAPTYHSLFHENYAVCSIKKIVSQNRTIQMEDKLSEVNILKNNLLEKTQDDNASVEVLVKKLDEKDQLETYSQFAERVNAENKNGASVSITNRVMIGQKHRRKNLKSNNYASPDCGAKLVSASQKALQANKIIQTDKDEYMLNKCSDEIFAVVELCQVIRPHKFDIANFELFSSQPKDIKLYGSHRFPTRKWVELGVFQGQEGSRYIQSFLIETEEFFKFIKFEILSSYGNEYYCPVSFFRVYGLTEMEILYLLEEPDEIIPEEEMAEEEKPRKIEKEKPRKMEEEKPKKLKVRIGILPMVKSVFRGMMNVIKRGSVSTHTNSSEPEINSVFTLRDSFAVTNNSCFISESLNYILSCYYEEYSKLLLHPLIAGTVSRSYFCTQLSTISCSDPDMKDSLIYDTICNGSYACVMLSSKHMLALCHMHDTSVILELLSCLNLTDWRRSNSSSIVNTQPHNWGVSSQSSSHSEDEHSYSKSLKTGNKNVISTEEEKQRGAVVRPSNTTLDQKKMNATVKDLKEATDGTVEVQGTTDRVASKEPIVVRLSNKIKALEKNMSISSQYLEELSRRYKRQMEEMQERFNGTFLALNRTSRAAFERDVQQERRIERLENKLEKISLIIKSMAHQQEILITKVVEYHLILFIVEVLVLCFGFMCLCTRNALVKDSNDYVKKKCCDPSRCPIRRGDGVAPVSSVRRRSLGYLDVDETPTKRRKKITSKEEASDKRDYLLVEEVQSQEIPSSSSSLQGRKNPSKKTEKASTLSPGSSVEELEAEWQVVRRGKKRLVKPAGGFCVQSGGSAPALECDGPIVSDYYEAKSSNAGDAPRIDANVSTTTQIWALNRSFTKTTELSDFTLGPLASTPHKEEAPLDYGWVNTTKAIKELFPLPQKEVTVKCKPPNKTNKKKKNKTTRGA